MTQSEIALNLPPAWVRDRVHRGPGSQRFTVGLLALDAGAVLGALALASAIASNAHSLSPSPGLPSIVLDPFGDAMLSVVWLTVFGLVGLYDRDHLLTGLGNLSRVVNACSVGLVATVATLWLVLPSAVAPLWLLLIWGLAIVLVWTMRSVGDTVLRAMRSRGLFLIPTVIVGANEEGQALAEQLMSRRGSGWRVMGFVEASLPRGTQISPDLAVLGGYDDLGQILQQTRAQQIIVATTAVSAHQLLELHQALASDSSVRLRMSAGIPHLLNTEVRLQGVSGTPLVVHERVRVTGVQAILKVTMDYLGATCGLILLAPALLILAVLVKLDSDGPVIHRRRVLGRNGQPFDAFKFRTMVANAEQLLAENLQLRQDFEKDYKLQDDPRVTRVGRLLRRLSLDELPQLVNVLRGEMSLVGPRMIAPDEAPRYGQWRLNLLTVKPGITGPWQVQGRADLPYEDRVRLSMAYIRNYSIWLDAEILLRTMMVVLRGRGAY